MRRISALAILFLIFRTAAFGEIREHQRMERITREVTRISSFETNLRNQTENNEEKQGWIKRHPVITGTFIGFGVGAALGQGSQGDYSAFGKVIFFGGIGACIGALVGKVASEY